jgi:hypothetical protein
VFHTKVLHLRFGFRVLSYSYRTRNFTHDVSCPITIRQYPTTACNCPFRIEVHINPYPHFLLACTYLLKSTSLYKQLDRPRDGELLSRCCHAASNSRSPLSRDPVITSVLSAHFSFLIKWEEISYYDSVQQRYHCRSAHIQLPPPPLVTFQA